MLAVDQNKIQIRFRRTPSHLQDLIFDEKENDIIDTIGQEFGLSLDKKQRLANVCLLVFLGFLSINDVGKEIAESVELDRAVAEKISGKLYDRIFSFVKEEINANYKPEFTPDEEKKPEPEEVVEKRVDKEANEPVFLLNSLAPLEKSLNTSHPEASQIPPKPTTQESGDSKAQPQAPVALYSESEVMPLKETFEITGPAGAQNTPEVPPKPYTGPASVQFGGFEIPKPTQQEHKQKETISTSKPATSSLPEFIPTPTSIKNTASIQTIPQPEQKKETVSDAPKFIAFEANPTSQANTITTAQPPKPAPETTQKPVVMNFTEKPLETSGLKKNEPTEQKEPVKTAPKGLLGKLSSMVLGLGEKPAPLQNRTFGPPELNAKVIDYGMPKPEEPQKQTKEPEKMVTSKTPEFFAISLEPTTKKQEPITPQAPPIINPVVNLKKPTNTPPPPLPPYKN